MPSGSKVNNKLIFKNTLYMYLRMFVILGVTLYTARIVIRALGIDDYGIYNIVGGIVILFSFVNISLRTAIQRFISYELGKDDIENSHKILASSFVVVAAFSIIFLVLAETIGLWFVTNKLVIPVDKYIPALWVYQISIFTFIIQMFQTPYHAVIISHEKMSFYAAYSIVEVLMKLIVAFLIVYASEDRLILYSILGLVISLISLIIICIYSTKKLSVPFKLSGYRLHFRPIFSYAGWGMTNSSTVIVAQQGGNILLNLFVGVIANGAFGIANQVTTAVYGFVSNFQSAFNPQITKSYAAGELDATFKLINRSSIFSFCLLAIIAVPFFIESEYILSLWLGESPEYAAGFCNLMILYFLIDSVQAPLWMLIYATGKVRNYQIWTGCIQLLNIPIAWYLLYVGFSAYWVFIVRVSLNFITSIIRPIYIHNLVSDFSLKSYCSSTLFPIFRMVLICGIIVSIGVITKDSIHPLILIIVSIIITLISLFFTGLKQSERIILKEIILNKLAK